MPSRMQKLIEKLLAQHGLPVKGQVHLRLSQEQYQPLVIERLFAPDCQTCRLTHG